MLWFSSAPKILLKDQVYFGVEHLRQIRSLPFYAYFIILRINWNKSRGSNVPSCQGAPCRRERATYKSSIFITGISLMVAS